MTDSRWLDPEIDSILEGDPELIQLAHLVRAARPEPKLDPRFQAVLRAQLMREAALGAPAAAGQKQQRVARQHTARRGWWRRPTPFAWTGAGLGVALAAAAVISIVSRPLQDHQLVTAGSPVAELHQVGTDNVITVAFSQPMNHQAVVSGLHIRPATQVTTAWQGNNLLITPTHKLTGNTPYTVTIDRTAAQAANGAVASADIHISFGTAPTPPPAPVVATLSPTVLGPVDPSALLVAGPSGSVIATSSTAAPAGATQPAGTTPTPTATATPSSASATPAPSGSRSVLFGSSGVSDAGPAATSAALSANGLRLVSAVSTGSGSQIVLSTLHSGKSTVLTTLGVPVLATGWLSADTAVVAESDRILTVDLQGHVSDLLSLPQGTSAVTFAPAGGHAFAGSAGADGTLFDLVTKQGRILPGSRTLAAFSGDGRTVAWIDTSRPIAQMVTSPVARDHATTIPLDHPGDNVAELALDQTGARAAIIDQPAAGGSELDINALPSGTLIARGPTGSHPVFTSSGNRVGLVSADGQAETATLPGGVAQGASTALPDGAAGLLDTFVNAQSSGDVTTIAALTVPSLNAVQATPDGLTRAYVISAAVNPDGTIAATARLIIDASVAHPLASFADESLTLTPSAATTFQVSAISVGPLHDEPVGPHVVHVTPTSVDGMLVLQVGFDSDLRPGSVAPAISVTTLGGQVLQATTVYDEERRTAVVTLSVPADTPVSVTVGSGLLDVDGQALAGVFTTAVGG